LDQKVTGGLLGEKRASLHIAVSNVLGEEVVSGKLPIGDLLPPEPELCSRFGVSRTVVREAVKHLTSKGLLRTSSGIGTWVPPAQEWNFLDPTVFTWVQASGKSENLFQHLFSFRSAIEPAAAAAAARSAKPGQLAEMKAALDVMCSPDPGFKAWVAADVNFHSAIYIGSNNVFMASLANLFREYFQMSFSVSSSNAQYQHCLQEHVDLYEAIAARRPADAQRAVQVLLVNAHEDVRQVLSRGLSL